MRARALLLPPPPPGLPHQLLQVHAGCADLLVSEVHAAQQRGQHARQQRLIQAHQLGALTLPDVLSTAPGAQHSRAQHSRAQHSTAHHSTAATRT
jgi:hypothetical protein